MNSLYTHGVRQTNSIQADLERLRTGDASASLLGLSAILISSHIPTAASSELLDGLGSWWSFEQWRVWIWMDFWRLTVQPFFSSLLGQISASLAAMNRTVEDYDSMAKREMIKAKQEKAMMSVSPLPLHSLLFIRNALTI